MKVIIDRFEGEYAVVEKDNGQYVNIPKELLIDAGEGDVVEIIINHKETEQRKQHIEKLMNKVFE